MKKIWKKSLIASFVVVIIVVLVIFGIKNNNAHEAASGEGEELMVQKAKEQDLSETILVTGEVVPEAEQKVYADPEKGEIKEFKVKENQEVKAGDPLFIYDEAQVQRELNQAIREKKSIENRANIVQNQMTMLDKQIAEAKKANEPKEALHQLELEKQELAIEHEGTKAEIDAAQEMIQSLNEQKKESTVTSKLDGIVVKVNDNPVKGETGGGEPVVHIVSNQPFKVVGTMSEFDAVKIKLDQEVIVRPKVYKDREWKGIVESVSQFPSDDGGGMEDFYGGGGGNVTMYPFKVALTGDTSELRQGFHVSLEVKLGGGKGLAVPFTAVIDEDGVEVVYILKDNVLERREVETGSVGDEFIQIKKGVAKNDLVVVSPYEGMADGMEVNSFVEIE